MHRFVGIRQKFGGVPCAAGKGLQCRDGHCRAKSVTSWKGRLGGPLGTVRSAYLDVRESAATQRGAMVELEALELDPRDSDSGL